VIPLILSSIVALFSVVTLRRIKRADRVHQLAAADRQLVDWARTHRLVVTTHSGVWDLTIEDLSGWSSFQPSADVRIVPSRAGAR
jgi:hypothetical protein